MKLDRNTNPNGRGKYALINMRKFDALPPSEIAKATESLNKLARLGVVTLGSESNGDQFFVMKYKDRFASAALKAYATEAANFCSQLPEDKALELAEYAADIFCESILAARGRSIPD